jgi:predicted small secreted protein
MKKIVIFNSLIIFSILFSGCATAQGVQKDFEDYTPIVKESLSDSAEWIGETYDSTKESVTDYFEK